MHTTLYDPDGTYPEFADADVRTSPLNRVGALRRDHRLALPLLAPAVVADADRRRRRRRLQQRLGPRLRHPGPHGRLLPQPGPLALPDRRVPRRLRLALAPRARPSWRCAPSCKRWDRRRADRVDVYLANSRVVQQRIATTYGRDAELLPPPHGMDASRPARAGAGARRLGARLRAGRLPAAALQERRRRHRGRARHRPAPRRRRPRPGGGAPARDPARQRPPARRAQRRAAAGGRTPTRGCWSPPATRTSGWLPSRRRPSACRPSRCAAAASSRPSSRARPGSSSTSPTPDGHQRRSRRFRPPRLGR